MRADEGKPRRRKLTEEERALWRRVVRSIAPLSEKQAKTIGPAEQSVSVDAKPARSTVPRLPSAGARLTPSAPALQEFDRRQKQRLARGTQSLDARLDLHGKTQSEAHAALFRFVRKAQRDGAKFVLVITGKGSRIGGHWDDRGVLNRQVPHWLMLSEFRPYVVGFESAHASHGGAGALYLRIRKPTDRKER
jgi:DNA-nicking Smr family endonuclease